jgi:hypothetical protein
LSLSYIDASSIDEVLFEASILQFKREEKLEIKFEYWNLINTSDEILFLRTKQFATIDCNFICHQTYPFFAGDENV